MFVVLMKILKLSKDYCEVTRSWIVSETIDGVDVSQAIKHFRSEACEIDSEKPAANICLSIFESYHLEFDAILLNGYLMINKFFENNLVYATTNFESTHSKSFYIRHYQHNFWHNKNFMQLVNRKASRLDEVSKFIKAWENGNKNLPLHEYLGLPKRICDHYLKYNCFPKYHFWNITFPWAILISKRNYKNSNFYYAIKIESSYLKIKLNKYLIENSKTASFVRLKFRHDKIYLESDFIKYSYKNKTSKYHNNQVFVELTNNLDRDFNTVLKSIEYLLERKKNII